MPALVLLLSELLEIESFWFYFLFFRDGMGRDKIEMSVFKFLALNISLISMFLCFITA